MAENVGETIAAGVAAIIGLAVIALLVSQRANTANVIGAAAGGLSNLIGVAISPVTGAQTGAGATGLAGGSWTAGGTYSGFAIAPGFGVNTAGNALLAGAASGAAGALINQGFSALGGSNIPVINAGTNSAAYRAVYGSGTSSNAYIDTTSTF
jgi:hypothetical protein